METLQAKSVQSIISVFSKENQKDIIKGILTTEAGKEVLDRILYEERLQLVLNHFHFEEIKILIRKSPLAQKFLIKKLLEGCGELSEMNDWWQMWFSTRTTNQSQIIGLCKCCIIPEDPSDTNVDRILFVTRSLQKCMETENLIFEKFNFEKHVKNEAGDIGDRFVVSMQGKLMSWWLSPDYF